MLALLVAIGGAAPAPAQDVLKYQAAVNGTREWAQAYRVFSTTPYVAQSGDRLEYDLYLVSPVGGVGGIDAVTSDAVRWRDQPDYTDAAGVSGHPAADLSRLATTQWTHRSLSVPAAVIGRTTSEWYLAIDGAFEAQSMPGAWYDNIAITRNGQTVLTLYAEGAAPADTSRLLSRGASWHQTHAGPIRRSDFQSGTFFFYWYEAPGSNADPNQMPFHPYGLISDPWSGYNGGYYSILNTYWWEQELTDLRLAGLDTAALICWGDHPNNQSTGFKTSSLPTTLVPALDRAGSGVKISMFDDTTSQSCEWNWANGRNYYPTIPMPLSDQSLWVYFYDRKIKPFFQAIPQRHWATHNGQPLEAGGRPIIITYSAAWFSDVGTMGGPLYQWVKDRFAADFRDANNNPIVPWLIHERSWFTGSAGSVADGRYSWGAATNNGNRNGISGFEVVNIGAGYDDTRIRTPGLVANRSDGGRLLDSFYQRSSYSADLLMLETWNELWEGTPIQRCKDYPRSTGGTLPETFYMDRLRRMIAGSAGLRPYDATFLRTWRLPAQAKASSVISITVRNDGALPWLPGEVTLGGRLMNATTGALIAGSERTALAPLSRTVLSGEEYTFDFSPSSTWPFNATYQLQLDMNRQGTWFASFGDAPVTRTIVFNPTDATAPSPPTSFNSTAGARSVTLSWRAPSSSDVSTVMLRMNLGSYPTAVTGTLVTNRPASPGGLDSYTVYPLSPGTTYYFSVFAQDAAGNISSRTNRMATCNADTTPPAPIISFRVHPDGGSTGLSWINPSDVDFKGAIVRYRSDIAPIGPTDGLLIADVQGRPGATSGCGHPRGGDNSPRFYAVFAYDESGNFAAAPALATPPAPLNFTATPTSTRNTLRWTTPSGETYVNTVIVFRTDRSPTSPVDGTVLYDASAAWGTQLTLPHIGLANGTTYYYAAFALNGSGGYASPALASATPFGYADFDRDGDVDLSDFGRFQACMGGPAVWMGWSCEPADLDQDYDVDADDLAAFTSCMSGPNIYANPACVTP